MVVASTQEEVAGKEDRMVEVGTAEVGRGAEANAVALAEASGEALAEV